MTSGLPVTCEDALIIKEPPPLNEQEYIVKNLENYVQEYSTYSKEYRRMKKEMYEAVQMPSEPCYITSELYNKAGKLVHVVGKGEFSGLDENGKPMLLYDKYGLPKNADGSVRKLTVKEMIEIQKERSEELPSNLPRKPKMIKRKQPKKRKNPPPTSAIDNFDKLVAAEAERLRKINERL